MEFTVSESLDRVRAAARAAVENRRLTIKAETDTEIIAKSGFALRSWGERIAITMTPAAWQTTVQIESRPIAQLVDWGRGAEHLAALAASMRAILGGN